ncbi:hypothetical protein C8Q70DRAFT_330659 [Cubamyces menziesii]|nr:hypothetical protein C8Q70DRAFT_330659 [Cubamyces menziesii]
MSLLDCRNNAPNPSAQHDGPGTEVLTPRRHLTQHHPQAQNPCPQCPSTASCTPFPSMPMAASVAWPAARTCPSTVFVFTSHVERLVRCPRAPEVVCCELRCPVIAR